MKPLATQTPINVSRQPRVRAIIDRSIACDTVHHEAQHAPDIPEKAFCEHPMTSDVIVSFTQFVDSSLDLKVIHWWNGTGYGAYMAGMRELNLQLKKRLDHAGLSFAFPAKAFCANRDST